LSPVVVFNAVDHPQNSILLLYFAKHGHDALKQSYWHPFEIFILLTTLVNRVKAQLHIVLAFDDFLDN